MRYLLYAGEHYYPAGGHHDFVKGGDSLALLVRHGRKLLKGTEMDSTEWWHVVDTTNGKVVAGTEQQPRDKHNLTVNRSNLVVSSLRV